MNTELNQLFAAYFVASKFATKYENAKKNTGGRIQQHVYEQVMSSGEKVQSVSAQNLRGQRDGIYRVLFGGASALAYYEEKNQGIATFKFFDGRKKSGSVKLREKEELAAILGVEVNKKIPTHVTNTAIIDELVKRFPELSASGISSRVSYSLVASRKREAPTIEDAISEISHWLILKKIETIRSEIDVKEEDEIAFYSAVHQRHKLAEELKDFIGGCIRGHVNPESIPSNEFVNSQPNARINYDREKLKEIIGGSTRFSTVISEQDHSKSGVELRWCGKIDQIEGGYLPRPLIDQLKSAQTPGEEKEVKQKLTQQVFFRNNPTIPITSGFKPN